MTDPLHILFLNIAKQVNGERKRPGGIGCGGVQENSFGLGESRPLLRLSSVSFSLSRNSFSFSVQK
jgi:hypothetical protein